MTSCCRIRCPAAGIFKDTLATYNTAVAVSALAAADDPSLRPQLDKAIAYLRTMQWNDRIVGPKGETIADPKYAAFAGRIRLRPQWAPRSVQHSVCAWKRCTRRD
jgi:hypothetical protein